MLCLVLPLLPGRWLWCHHHGGGWGVPVAPGLLLFLTLDLCQPMWVAGSWRKLHPGGGAELSFITVRTGQGLPGVHGTG